MECIYGPLVKTIPLGWVPKEQWPEYHLRSHPPAVCGSRDVGTKPKGVQWWLWPLCFEEYTSDDAPDLSLSDPHHTARARIVVWRRITRQDFPGWRTWPWWSGPSRLEGFSEVRPEYWIGWSESARRYRKKWLTQYLDTRYMLERVDYETFEKAYLGSSVARTSGGDSIHTTRNMEIRNPRAMEYIVARRIPEQTIAAGIALIHSPSTGNSYYAAGFYLDSAKHDPVMTGLIDYWYQLSLERGFRFLHFGEFWKPGSPKAARGYSAFKAKFGLSYILYPQLVARFVRGRLW